MKKIFTALPIIGLILGAVAIATEIKTTDPLPLGQQLSGVVISCIKVALEKKETDLISAAATYQNSYIDTLTTKRSAVLAAWGKATKKDIKSALTAASKAYKANLHVIKKDLKASQKIAKSTYTSAIKACKATGLQNLIQISDVED
ncbi:MAG: hypothetical protein WC606_02050 [Candidatus Absconditabacterales bacterium]|jgi:hypothetical protein